MLLFLTILCAAITIFVGLLALRACRVIIFGGFVLFDLIMTTVFVLVAVAAGYGAFYFGSQIG